VAIGVASYTEFAKNRNLGDPVFSPMDEKRSLAVKEFLLSGAVQK
jgi:hypothetical protein